MTMEKRPKEKEPKRAVGGSAAERGLDFQARVSAIVLAHLLVERSIGWLIGVLDDAPLDLYAETGGPGDDVRFVAKGGKQVEVQAKRGLQRGGDLWAALLSLARGISKGTIDAGVLAVCPNSSGTIREALSEDIVRLGTGRSDGLRDIGTEFSALLTGDSLDPSLVCRRLRIVVVSAVEGNREAEATASERLSRTVHDPQAAWRALVEYARQLIRRRGRGTPEQTYRELLLAGVALKTSEIETHVQLLAAMREWLHKIHAQITILGVRGLVPFDACWLALDAHLMEGGLAVQEELDKALQRYHDYSYGRRRSEQKFDSQTIGRFVNECVVLGGPGIGKSTLLKKLALDYSNEGFLTLLVRLPQVAALVSREGRRFEDSLVDVALSESGIRAPLTSLESAVVLCDGLDECGNLQPLVTAALHAFSIAHPRARIVVASRPIGYRPGEIAGWRHYELQPLSDTETEKAITRVLEAIPFPNAAVRDKAITFAKGQLKAQSIKGAASRSPLMITLIAALSAKGIDPGDGKATLYRQLFQLIEDHPPARLAEIPPSEPERSRFLELLGWSLLENGNEPADRVFERCSKWWREETGLSALASEAKIRACFDYWECLGVVERVRTLTQEAVTFVHKTFGEFAAARYMAKCEPALQRVFITRAIQSPDWKEAFSFASHLGMATLILEVWAELAEAGDTKAGYRLDDAIELVVQAGIPIGDGALASFAECCWRAVGNTASRTRYAAGEALCVASKDHWDVVRKGALDRLEGADHWSRLVAWACLSVSPESKISLPGLVAVLRDRAKPVPGDSYLSGLHLKPSGSPVWQYLVRGAAKRILSGSPDPDGLDALTSVIGRGEELNVGTIGELEGMFKRVGLEFPEVFHESLSRTMASFFSDRHDWNREAAYLLDVVDDSTLMIEGGSDEDASQCWELGALLTATSYWNMPLSDCWNMSEDTAATESRRMVIHGVARAARLDKAKLVSQARVLRKQILDAGPQERLALFELPRVDVDAQFETAVVGVEAIGELEKIILGGGDFFPLNAGQLLWGLRDRPEYRNAVEYLLTRGRGESMRISAALACELPDGLGQQLCLNRLCTGEMTPGCRYLYEQLTPPFNACHLGAVRRGLDGQSAESAKAAAELAAKLPLDGSLASELRYAFEQWKTKEKPYPKAGGTVPDSPRDKLAKILVIAFPDDHAFLLELLKDDRPDVRAAGREPLLAAAAASPELRTCLVEEVESGILEPTNLRSAIEKGLYTGSEAVAVAMLLRSTLAPVRYAALPILDARFLPVELVRTEGARLLSDSEMDIRESANRVLKKLNQPISDS